MCVQPARSLLIILNVYDFLLAQMLLMLRLQSLIYYGFVSFVILRVLRVPFFLGHEEHEGSQRTRIF